MKAKFYQLQSKLGLVKFLEMGAGEQDAETTTGKTDALLAGACYPPLDLTSIGLGKVYEYMFRGYGEGVAGLLLLIADALNQKEVRRHEIWTVDQTKDPPLLIGVTFTLSPHEVLFIVLDEINALAS